MQVAQTIVNTPIVETTNPAVTVVQELNLAQLCLVGGGSGLASFD
jgi:alcohol dehydrogenase YqhD (iron-dependent ADH family)